MSRLLWLIPALPLGGFLLCLAAGHGRGRRAALAGTVPVGLSAALSFAAAASFIASPPPGGALAQTLWTWIPACGLAPAIALRFDALSLAMTVVVSTVSFLILLYSSEFMAGDDGFARFFAWMDLFVASMLLLVLADDLLVLYLGWEGVGLCSFLLIGFWHRDPANVRAARKAFIVTRIGDAAMAVGLVLMATRLGTLAIPELSSRALAAWPAGSPVAVAAAALLLAGAAGKSAQLPLQTWLPDAMAGPTPVSALIHAATMVTAGVYLIARMHVLFSLAPCVERLVALAGALTLLLAASAALAQEDLKRALAYSTMSQVGYMFLALGAGAWSAAVFHLVTHAFFKSLLFLAAGGVIMAIGGAHSLSAMGGLRRALPGTFAAFLVGASSLAALPLVTAGFYSKEWILDGAWSSSRGGAALWAAGAAGALLTGIYAFRLVFLVFGGEARTARGPRPGFRMGTAMAVLAFLSLAAGFVRTPPGLGGFSLFSRLMATVLPPVQGGAARGAAAARLAAALLPCAGVLIAWRAYGRRGRGAARGEGALLGLLRDGWGFDRAYDALFVRPYAALARLNRDDLLDRPNDAIARACVWAHRLIAPTENGRARRYAAAIAVGAIVLVAIMVWT